MGWVGQGQHLLWRILLCKIQPQIPPKKNRPARAWRKGVLPPKMFEHQPKTPQIDINKLMKSPEFITHGTSSEKDAEKIKKEGFEA